MNLKFWQELVEYSNKNKNSLKISRKPGPQHWFSSSSGIPKIDITF